MAELPPNAIGALNSAKNDITNSQTKYNYVCTTINNENQWKGNGQKTSSKYVPGFSDEYKAILDQISNYEYALNAYFSLMMSASTYQSAKIDLENADSTNKFVYKSIMNNTYSEYISQSVNLTKYSNLIKSLEFKSSSGIFDAVEPELLFVSDSLEDIYSSLKAAKVYSDDAIDVLLDFDDSVYRKVRIKGMWPSELSKPNENLSSLKQTLIFNIRSLSTVIARITTILDRYKRNIENYENGKTVELDIETDEAKEAPVEEEKKEPVTYTVKPGDSLSKIAEKYGISWTDLYNANKDIIGNNPNAINVGIKLTIPGVEAVQGSSEVATEESEPEKIKAERIDEDILTLEGIAFITDFADIGQTVWNIDCDETDLTDLVSPTGKDLRVNACISPEEADSDYEYNRYVDNGHYVDTYNAYHKGTDFYAHNDDVHSISSGVVVSKTYDSKSGYRITVLSEVANDDGSVSYYATTYMHLSQVSVSTDNYVKLGDVVGPDDIIGLSGSSGTGSKDGAHLHVEMGKVNISEEDMSKCDSTADIVALYNKNHSVQDGSYINLGSYYLEEKDAVNRGNNIKDRK